MDKISVLILIVLNFLVSVANSQSESVLKDSLVVDSVTGLPIYSSTSLENGLILYEKKRVKDSIFEEWHYSNGVLAYSHKYSIPKNADTIYVYHDNGKLRNLCTFQNDTISGIWLEFSRNGALIDFRDYREGPTNNENEIFEIHITLFESESEIYNQIVQIPIKK